MQSPVQRYIKTALSLHQAGDFAAAMEPCLKALSVVPEHPDALYLLAVIQAQTKNWTLAEDYFKRAIKVNPQRAELFGNYANALLEQGKLADAIKQGQRAIALNPVQAQSLNILGNAYLLQGDYAMAEQYLREAIQQQPQLVSAHRQLGVALQKQQLFAEAIACFQQVLTLQNDDADALLSLGQTYQEAGNIAAAITCYQTLLSANPEHSKAQQCLREVDPNWLEPVMGRRVRLRRYQTSAADVLQQWYAQDDFMRLYNLAMPRQQSLPELTRKLRLSAAQHPCQSKTMEWIIGRVDTARAERAIGVANLVDIQFSHRRAEFLLGIPNLNDRRGHAGVEASLLVMDFAFNRVGLHKLTSYVYANNPFAQQNTLALGFIQEGYLREHLVESVTGQHVDVYVNGLTVTDFRNNRHLGKLSMRLLNRDITSV